MVEARSQRHVQRWLGLRELAIFAAGYLLYFGVRALTEGSVADAVANAASVAHVERLVGIDWEPSLQSAILGHHLLVRLANWVYIFGHWPLLLISGFLLFRYRRSQYYLLRNGCLLSGALGLAIFALFPVAPPRLAHLGVVDTVTQYAGSYRTFLPAGLVNEYAAMPSFHAGWNVLLGIVLFRASGRRAVRAFAIAMPLLMVLSILVTANHFVLDAIVGTAIVLVAVALLDHRSRRRTRPTLAGHAIAGHHLAPERSHPRRATAVRDRPSRGQLPGVHAPRSGARDPGRRG